MIAGFISIEDWLETYNQTYNTDCNALQEEKLVKVVYVLQNMQKFKTLENKRVKCLSLPIAWREQLENKLSCKMLSEKDLFGLSLNDVN